LLEEILVGIDNTIGVYDKALEATKQSIFDEIILLKKTLNQNLRKKCDVIKS